MKDQSRRPRRADSQWWGHWLSQGPLGLEFTHLDAGIKGTLAQDLPGQRHLGVCQKTSWRIRTGA